MLSFLERSVLSGKYRMNITLFCKVRFVKLLSNAHFHLLLRFGNKFASDTPPQVYSVCPKWHKG